jgi:hypothetical protein
VLYEGALYIYEIWQKLKNCENKKLSTILTGPILVFLAVLQQNLPILVFLTVLQQNLPK